MLEDEDGNTIIDPVVTRPFRLDKVNATLASGHYVIDDDLGDDDHDDTEDKAWRKDEAQ